MFDWVLDTPLWDVSNLTLFIMITLKGAFHSNFMFVLLNFASQIVSSYFET